MAASRVTSLVAASPPPWAFTDAVLDSRAQQSPELPGAPMTAGRSPKKDLISKIISGDGLASQHDTVTVAMALADADGRTDPDMEAQQVRRVGSPLKRHLPPFVDTSQPEDHPGASGWGMADVLGLRLHQQRAARRGEEQLRMAMKVPEPVKPFTVRTALIMFLALVVAIAAGILFYTAVQSIPLALLTGSAAFAGSWRFFDRLIG